MSCQVGEVSCGVLDDDSGKKQILLDDDSGTKCEL